MEHLQIPAILVECGFLSNYEEKELLKTEAYQTKIAMQIAASLIRFLSEYGNTL
jgi:N-acetylmuramoyl-L-alanine amidase